MVITLLLLLRTRHAPDGLQRFHDFLAKNPSFSVDLNATTDHVPMPGTGTYVVKGPACFKLSMRWGAYDYNYVKNESDAVEYVNSDKTYQQFGPSPRLEFYQSVASALQLDSLPLLLLFGDPKRLVPDPKGFKLTGTHDGAEVYTDAWGSADATGAGGKVIATIDGDGKLLALDYYVHGMTGTVHRVMSFSNYKVNPKMGAEDFNTDPPLGYTTYKFPYPEQAFWPGAKLNLGKWKWSGGSTDIDSSVAGKLLIVRVSDSAPADALQAYLAKHKLPVKSVVLSLGNSGGQYYAPSPDVAEKLSRAGTPLMILLTADNRIKGLWLGFDPDSPLDLASAISKSLGGQGSE